MDTRGAGLDPALIDALRAQLPAVADRTVTAVIEEVPDYLGAWLGPMGETIHHAVQTALAGFLVLAAREEGADAATPLRPALDGAYELGRGEARSGRSMDALLGAYRVGARVAWRELAGAAVSHGLAAAPLARFAELVFAYIDQLSAASAAGHADELASEGRLRQRRLERLAQQLLSDVPRDVLAAAAERAGWGPPASLTAVVVPEEQAGRVLAEAAAGSLAVPVEGEEAVLLLADLSRRGRQRVLGVLAGRRGAVGPSRPWLQAASSYRLARRALALGWADADLALPALVLTADPEALEELRRRALEPLADLRPTVREKLEETLRAWLLHLGRREAVAAHLFVHPQTVRYRMGQLRERYGDRLDDPQEVLHLTLALGVQPDRGSRSR